MSENVVSLDTGRSLDEDNKERQAAVEAMIADLAEMAKDGRIKGVVSVALTDDDMVWMYRGGVVDYATVGGLASMQQSVLRILEDN